MRPTSPSGDNFGKKGAWSIRGGKLLPVLISNMVWFGSRRKRRLRGEFAIRMRQIVRDKCSELEVEIIKGNMGKEHVKLFVSCPPHVSSSQLMQRIKGKSSRQLLQECSHPKRQCWGRHLQARGFFVVSSGNITDEMIIEYIKSQNCTKEDEECKVEDP